MFSFTTYLYLKKKPACTKDMNLHSFVLDTLVMDVAHTSDNLIDQVKEVLVKWKIADKGIVCVSDNASDIAKALASPLMLLTVYSTIHVIKN